jgi:parvulin-like peptidyl-prolyl isomerase
LFANFRHFLAAGLILSLLVCGLAACNEDAAPTVAPQATVPGAVEATAPVAPPSGGDGGATPAPPPVTAGNTATPSSIPPSPTPDEPLAALVNGEPITLALYEKELSRYEQAQIQLGQTPGASGEDYRAQVLDVLIEQKLIAQAAREAGIAITDEEVSAKLSELATAAGDAQNFAAWMEANQWTEEEFRQALAAEMLTERLVAQVTADVPYAVEQVRARYVQVDDPTLAQSILDQIRAGGDIAALAAEHSLDPTTAPNGGDLGFFARGSLLVPEVEEAAYSLQPGETSEIIAVTNSEGRTTYYIVQTVERDPQRALSADLRSNLLRERFEGWLADLWGTAEISRFVNGSQPGT